VRIEITRKAEHRRGRWSGEFQDGLSNVDEAVPRRRKNESYGQKRRRIPVFSFKKDPPWGNRFLPVSSLRTSHRRANQLSQSTDWMSSLPPENLSPEEKARRIAALLTEQGPALALYAAQWADNPDDCVQEGLIRLARQATWPDNEVAWLYR